jgi:glutamyl-tRNA reductase
MHQHFKAVSLSYKKAPLQVREVVALTEDGCKHMLNRLKKFLTFLKPLFFLPATELRYTMPPLQTLAQKLSNCFVLKKELIITRLYTIILK